MYASMHTCFHTRSYMFDTRSYMFDTRSYMFDIHRHAFSPLSYPHRPPPPRAQVYVAVCVGQSTHLNERYVRVSASRV